MDEQILIEKAQNGDIEAFNLLVVEYQDRVYNVAYRIMGEHGAADDAAQETFISAHRALKQFRGGSFGAWLMRIATNNCYDELRRRKRHPVVPLTPDPDDDFDEDYSEHMTSHVESPERTAQRADLSEAIAHCIDALPDDQRVVLVLGDVQDYSYAEIADIAGVSLGTVKSRMSRARAKVRDCLQGFEELLPAQFRLYDRE